HGLLALAKFGRIRPALVGHLLSIPLRPDQTIRRNPISPRRSPCRTASWDNASTNSPTAGSNPAAGDCRRRRTFRFASILIACDQPAIVDRAPPTALPIELACPRACGCAFLNFQFRPVGPGFARQAAGFAFARPSVHPAEQKRSQKWRSIG